MTTKLTRVIVTSLFATIFTVGVGFINTHSALADSTALGVTQITAIANGSGTVGYATADNTYADGWRWDFYVTVPNNQTLLKMKFADWISGSNIIPAGGNIQIYSAQSTNAMDEAHAIPITASSTWGDIMNLNPNIDEDVSMGGRQIDIIVEAKIPTGSAGGSYSTSYGINTTATSSISFDGLTQTYNGTPEAVSITTTPANLPTTVTYSGTDYTSTTTAPTHAGTYTVNAVITDPGYTGTSTATLTINPEFIAVVAVPKTKVYDGATSTDPVLTYTVTPSIYSGDSFTGALARDPGETAGQYLIATGTLAIDGDYAMTFVPNYFTITQASSTISLGDLEQSYDKTGKSVSVTTSPVGLSTSVTYDGLATLPVNAGTHIVVATITDPNYTGSSTQNLVIDPAPITVTATTSTKVYDASTTSDGVPTITSGTIFSGDTAPAWTQTFDTKDVGTEKTLTATGTITDGNDGNNYHVMFDTATGSITPATATVTATGINKVYDGTTDTSTTLNVIGAVGGDTLTAADTATFVSKDVADNIEVDVTGITLSGALAGDYLYNTTASTTADITPAPLTITANNLSKTYGITMVFAGTEFTSSGLASGDTISSVTLTSNGTASTSPIGPYSITPSAPQGIDLSDYTTTYNPGTLTVTSAPVTVTADPKTKVYGATDPTLTYQITSGSLFNGDSFTGTIKRDVGENVGTYSINQGTLSLGGNYDLTFATSTFTITAATSSVSIIGDLSQTYGSTTALTATTTPVGLFTNITYSNGNYPASTTLPINAGTYDVVATVINSNYTGSTTGSLVINPAPITVTATTTSKTYDASTTSDGIPSITTGQLFYGNQAVWTQTYNDKNVGNNKILTPAGIVNDGNGGANYSVTYATTTGVINAAPLTVSATGVNKTYDGTNVAVVKLSDNRIIGDVFDDNYSSANFLDANVGVDKQVDVYGISISDTDAGNYSLTNTSASTTADIASSTLTITANDITKTYGDDLTLGATSTGFTTSGLFSPDNVSGITLTSTGAASTSLVSGSPYSIIPSDAQGSRLDNYSIVYDTGKLTVNPKTLTALLTASNKVYDGTTAASTTCSLTGVINNDSVTCTSVGIFNSRNAYIFSDNYNVTANLSLSGQNVSNYTLGANTTATASAQITPLPITVIAQADAKTYDGTTTASTLPTLSSSRGSGNDALGTGDTANFVETYANKNFGSGLTLTPSGTITDGNGGLNYTIIKVATTTGVINAEPLTITAQPSTKVYDGTASSTVTPVITSGTIFPVDTAHFTESYNDATANTGKTLTATGTVDDNFGGADYTYTFVANDTGVITQATPTFTYNILGNVSAGTDISAIISLIDATSSFSGSFSYNPQSGTLSSSTPLTLQITFTPTDSIDYIPVTKTTTISVSND